MGKAKQQWDGSLLQSHWSLVMSGRKGHSLQDEGLCLFCLGSVVVVVHD